MSKYTTEVRFICESKLHLTESVGFNGPEGLESLDEFLSFAAPAIFKFRYPIFDEAYRRPLEVKILRHYYTREICEETFGLWQLRLCDRLNMIMPYYNELYKSALLKFNPFYDVEMSTSKNGSKDRDGKTNTNTTNTNLSSIDKKSNETTETENSSNSLGSTFKNANETNSKANDNVKTVAGNENEENNKTATESNVGKESGSNTKSANGSEITNTDENEVNSGTSGNSSTSDNWNKYSDTPQGAVVGLETDQYLTNATHTTNADNAIGNTHSNRENTTSRSSERTDNETAINVNEKNENKEYAGSENVSKNKSEIETNKNNETLDRQYSDSINDNRSEKDAGRGERNRNDSEIGNSTGTTTGEIKNVVKDTESYIETVVGKRSFDSYSKLLIEFRKTFINIDKMVIDELSDLFFGLW